MPLPLKSPGIPVRLRDGPSFICCGKQELFPPKQFWSCIRDHRRHYPTTVRLMTLSFFFSTFPMFDVIEFSDGQNDTITSSKERILDDGQTDMWYYVTRRDITATRIWF